MKYKFFKTFFLIATIASMLSCSKKIDEAYQNPNADVKVPVETLLAPIVASMVGNTAYHGPANDMRFIGRYIQNWQMSTSGDVYDQMGYTAASDNAASTWRTHYYDLGQNLMNMIKWAEEEKKWDYVGVGQAIFAWSWLTMSDYYGEIILKEAFNTSQLTFKYDTEPEVYDYVRQLCFKALDNLNKTGDGVSSANLAKGDQYLYNGDVNKWKKFVNGILARSYNHLSNKTSYKPDSVIYYANLSILTNDDNASLKYIATGSNRSANYNGPFSNNGIGSFRQSEYSVKLMTGANSAFPGVQDPRRWYMLKPNPNGTLIGVQPNKGVTAITNVNDRPNNFYGSTNTTTAAPAGGLDTGCTYIFKNYAESPILTASEVKFMIAEAALRKGDPALAASAYKDGIRLNFDMLSSKYSDGIPSAKLITTATRDAYIANPVVVPAQLTLSHIMLQKYISLWGHGILETWVDMRRYHYNVDKDPVTGTPVYADFTIPTGSNLYVDNGGLPVYRVRPRYNSEYVWNMAELIRIGADKANYHTKEGWFSQK